jgi:AcrR family transcriptional regulator
MRHRVAGEGVRFSVHERHAELLEMGKKLFTTMPYSELTEDAIAHEIGISKDLLYYYFPTRRAYFIDVARTVAAELLTKIDEIPGDNLLEGLVAGLSVYADYWREYARPFAELFSVEIELQPELRAIRDDTREELLARLLVRSPENTALMRFALSGWMSFASRTLCDWQKRGGVAERELMDLLVQVAYDTIAGVLATDIQECENRAESSDLRRLGPYPPS